jgi:hypothetical protein
LEERNEVAFLQRWNDLRKSAESWPKKENFPEPIANYTNIAGDKICITKSNYFPIDLQWINKIRSSNHMSFKLTAKFFSALNLEKCAQDQNEAN